ncbi:LysR family transcriptional regulator [Verticiella sediminum]|uniref:LysR family transcriptional regulator n=1 Tax=Verticiella sediminum TaxID=1247510 RepID=A0A556ATY4_9BURK|nr:LysR substrate-binding domain-containing protein [Verticiella sediminum]TSH96404.1 LysR family transcriptional regulator [Verticiella sediminum]
MKLGNLPTLQAVVRRGNFAAAAQEMALTPSAVSQQMRQLEDYFGQPLFDRSGRAVKPTPFALELVGTVEQTLADLESLRDRSLPEAAGRLRLGVINSVMLSTLPAILRAMTERHPGIHVVLEPENTSGQLLESIKAGDIDAALVVNPQAGVSRKLMCDTLAQEPFVLLYPKEGRRRLSAEAAMARWPWVRYNGSLEGGRMASAFVRQVVPGLQPRYEIMTAQGVAGLVSEGLGFSVIPLSRQLRLSASAVACISLEQRMPRRQIVLARRAADADSRRINALSQCAREVYAAG